MQLERRSEEQPVLSSRAKAISVMRRYKQKEIKRADGGLRGLEFLINKINRRIK